MDLLNKNWNKVWAITQIQESGGRMANFSNSELEEKRVAAVLGFNRVDQKGWDLESDGGYRIEWKSSKKANKIKRNGPTGPIEYISFIFKNPTNMPNEDYFKNIENTHYFDTLIYWQKTTNSFYFIPEFMVKYYMVRNYDSRMIYSEIPVLEITDKLLNLPKERDIALENNWALLNEMMETILTDV